MLLFRVFFVLCVLFFPQIGAIDDFSDVSIASISDEILSDNHSNPQNKTFSIEKYFFIDIAKIQLHIGKWFQNVSQSIYFWRDFLHMNEFSDMMPFFLGIFVLISILLSAIAIYYGVNFLWRFIGIRKIIAERNKIIRLMLLCAFHIASGILSYVIGLFLLSCIEVYMPFISFQLSAYFSHILTAFLHIFILLRLLALLLQVSHFCEGIPKVCKMILSFWIVWAIGIFIIDTFDFFSISYLGVKILLYSCSTVLFFLFCIVIYNSRNHIPDIILQYFNRKFTRGLITNTSKISIILGPIAIFIVLFTEIELFYLWTSFVKCYKYMAFFLIGDVFFTIFRKYCHEMLTKTESDKNAKSPDGNQIQDSETLQTNKTMKETIMESKWRLVINGFVRNHAMIMRMYYLLIFAYYFMNFTSIHWTNFISISFAEKSINCILLMGFIYCTMKILNGIIDYYLIATDDHRVSIKLNTLCGIFKGVLKVIAFIAMIFVIVISAGYSISSLINALGVMFLGLALGMQSFVKDFISGLLIIIEQSILIGDCVVINARKGYVESFTLRNLYIRDAMTNTIIIIPFGELSTIENFNRGMVKSYFRVGFSQNVNTNAILNQLEMICMKIMKSSMLFRIYGVHFAENNNIEILISISSEVQVAYELQLTFLSELHKEMSRDAVSYSVERGV